MKKIILTLSVVCFLASTTIASISYAVLPGSEVKAVIDKATARDANNMPTNSNSKDTDRAAIEQEKNAQEQSATKETLFIGIAASIFLIVGTLLTHMTQ